MIFPACPNTATDGDDDDDYEKPHDVDDDEQFLPTYKTAGLFWFSQWLSIQQAIVVASGHSGFKLHKIDASNL